MNNPLEDDYRALCTTRHLSGHPLPQAPRLIDPARAAQIRADVIGAVSLPGIQKHDAYVTALVGAMLAGTPAPAPPFGMSDFDVQKAQATAQYVAGSMTPDEVDAVFQPVQDAIVQFASNPMEPDEEDA